MPQQTPQIPEAVVAAVRQILRPLVRLMIRHGVTLPAMVELLKQVLVDTVDKDLPVAGKRTTDSRVSVLTGVHRKDVKRLRETADRPKEAPKKIALGRKLVNTWMTDSAWQDENGAPLPLPRISEDPATPTFEKLAESLTTDVRARAILDELLRVGVVDIDAEERVTLLPQGFIPSRAEEEKLFYFEKASYAHLMASVKNLEGQQPPYFDRVVQYQALPYDAVPQLQALLEDQGMALLKKANTLAREERDRDQPDPPPIDKHKIAIGLYFYHEPAGED